MFFWKLAPPKAVVWIYLIGMMVLLVYSHMRDTRPRAVRYQKFCRVCVVACFSGAGSLCESGACIFEVKQAPVILLSLPLTAPWSPWLQVCMRPCLSCDMSPDTHVCIEYFSYRSLGSQNHLVSVKRIWIENDAFTSLFLDLLYKKKQQK